MIRVALYIVCINCIILAMVVLVLIVFSPPKSCHRWYHFVLDTKDVKSLITGYTIDGKMVSLKGVHGWLNGELMDIYIDGKMATKGGL